MLETGFIPKAPRLHKSQDYAFLRSEGLKYIEKLAHDLWTDYNIHDPGITLLELLCYAITDIGYRAGYDIKDILSEQRDGGTVIDPEGMQFHSAREVLPSAPVSFDDVRKILIDVPGVRNAWIEKNTGVRYYLDTHDQELRDQAPVARYRRRTLPLNGLYDVFIEYDETSRRSRSDVRDDVRDRVFAHRNLCEDVMRICDLEKEQIAVCANIAVRPSADLDALLAELFYRLENFISPPVRFYTLGELLARHKPVEKIFEGPALDHGFIDDDEFQQIKRRCELRVSDLVDLLMEKDLADVLAIRQISLLSFIDDKLRLQQDWILPLAAGKSRVPEFSPELSNIVFYKNDLPYFANRERVMELLQKKRAAEKRYKLTEGDRGDEGRADLDDLPMPTGEYRGLADYYPVQNDLPAVYGVGQVGIAESATPLRKAQAKQLKAFLLFFEQLLANYLSQLAQVRQLLSWADSADGSEQTYFSQVLEGIPGIEELYDPGALNGDKLQKKLDAIAETQRSALQRRSRVLDHLMARFCEDFTEYSLLMYSLYRDDEAASQRSIADKRAFLTNYPTLSSRRSTAYDYRDRRRLGNVSGFQQRVYGLLGIHGAPPRKLACERFEIRKSGEQWQFVLNPDPAGGTPLFESILCERRSSVEVLLDLALRLGGSAGNYREREGRYELVQRCPDEKDESALGSAPSPAARDEAIPLFKQFSDSEGFYVVEHILLRKRTIKDPFMPVQFNQVGDSGCCPEVTDPYSFRASVVLPSWPHRFRDLRFRRFVEDTLRREAPAHVFLRICWISHDQMKQFERDYGSWADQLARVEGQLGQCPVQGQHHRLAFMSGALPLPEAEDKDHPEREDYTSALRKLIETLHSLVTVFPIARLHDCKHVGGDEPPVTLNNTNLGTF